MIQEIMIDYRDLRSTVSGAFDNIISFHANIMYVKEHNQGFVSIYLAIRRKRISPGFRLTVITNVQIVYLINLLLYITNT